MSSLAFNYTVFYYVPETYPKSITNNDPIQHPFIPHHHVHHPLWYFDDANLFLNQRGILFGLHRQKFDISYFSQWLTHIEPCKTAAGGTTPSLPISIDNLSISTFIIFIQLLYRPHDFSTDINKWKNIKELAMTWGFVDITLTAMQKIQTIGSKRHSTVWRLPLRTTVLTKYWEEEIIGDEN